MGPGAVAGASSFVIRCDFSTYKLFRTAVRLRGDDRKSVFPMIRCHSRVSGPPAHAGLTYRNLVTPGRMIAWFFAGSC